MEKRIHIFNAGPAALPPEVLLEAKEHFFNFHGEGLSLMEMSHRGKTYDGVHFEAVVRSESFAGKPLVEFFPEQTEISLKVRQSLKRGLAFRDIHCRIIY